MIETTASRRRARRLVARRHNQALNAHRVVCALCRGEALQLYFDKRAGETWRLTDGRAVDADVAEDVLKTRTLPGLATRCSTAHAVKPIDTSAIKHTNLRERPMSEKSMKLELVAPPTPSDALDIEALWLDPALGDGLTDTSWHSIPVDKPKDFFRTHPDPEYRRRSEIYAHKTEGQIDTAFYILGPQMRGRLANSNRVHDGTPT